MAKRKSIKLGSGVKLNVNKKSASVTIGGKHLKTTINSSGTSRTTLSPMKGVSYTSTSSIGGSKRKSRQASYAPADLNSSSLESGYTLSPQAAPKPKKFRLYVAVFFMVGAVVGMTIGRPDMTAVYGIIAAFFYWWYRKGMKKITASQTRAEELPPLPVSDPGAAAAKPAPEQSLYKSLSEIPAHPITISKEKRNRQQGFPEDEYKNSGITKKGAFENFTAVDVETTGLAPYRDRIIQVSAIRFRDGEPVEKFSTFVNPKRHIPEEATEVNGITDEMVQDSPTFPEIVSDLEEFIGKDNIVGHNTIFDIKFLYYSGAKILEQKRKYFDTYQLSKRVVKGPSRYSEYDYDVEDHKLPTLLEYFDIPADQAHRSDSDALATGYLFDKLVEELQFDKEYV